MRGSRATIALGLAVLLALTLAGCGGASNPYGPGTAGTNSTNAPSGGGGGTAGGGGGGTGGYNYGGGSTTATTPTTPGTITMQNIAFNPSTMTVKVGDTVTFVNADSFDHHVVITGGPDLGVQAAGATTTWKPTKAGTYAMKCAIHPQMTGQITVR